jgi:hypothetical protein
METYIRFCLHLDRNSTNLLKLREIETHILSYTRMYSFSFRGFYNFRDGLPRLVIPQLYGHWTDTDTGTGPPDALELFPIDIS